MKFNLFINYYQDLNPARRAELDYCVLRNLVSFDNIVLVCSEKDKKAINHLISKPMLIGFLPAKTEILLLEERPTYNFFFEKINELFPEDDNINVIANTDIIIPRQSLELMPQYFKSKITTCLALSRWDLNINLKESELLDRWDSQDTWIFNGAILKTEGDFCMGTPGCDNAIAQRLEEAGYEVINPSKTIKTLHLHHTAILNYVENNTEAVPRPYKFINPHE